MASEMNNTTVYVWMFQNITEVMTDKALTSPGEFLNMNVLTVNHGVRV